MTGAVLLDLDRTLVDLQSYTHYDSAWHDVQRHLPHDLVLAGPDTGWSSATRSCMGVLAALPDGELWWTISNIIAEYETAAIGASVAMPGAFAFAHSLRTSARAVVTLLPEKVAREVLAKHNIDIPVIIGRDPLIRPKPSGDGLRQALELLEMTAADAFMIGDSTWDAAAAADADVTFIGVHSPREEFADQFPDVAAYETLADVFLALYRG